MIVTTAGSASGIAATARLTTVMSISSTGSPRRRPATNTRAQIPSAPTARRRPKPASRFWSGVLTSAVSWSIAAIFPTSVAMPVATATPRPRPYVTTVPLKHGFERAIIRLKPAWPPFATTAG